MKDNKSCLRFFFHPDYTVGIGITPIQSCDSWTLTTGEELHLALKILFLYRIANFLVLVKTF